jgi:DNA-binding NarL/FixJ family response regulator
VPTALVVDDHAGFRAAARALLELEAYTVVAEADTGEAAVARAIAYEPHLVLLDISLPDMSGFEVVERIAAARLRSLVVLTSNRDASQVAARARRSSARGFIPKEHLSAESLRELLGGAA